MRDRLGTLRCKLVLYRQRAQSSGKEAQAMSEARQEWVEKAGIMYSHTKRVERGQQRQASSHETLKVSGEGVREEMKEGVREEGEMMERGSLMIQTE